MLVTKTETKASAGSKTTSLIAAIGTLFAILALAALVGVMPRLYDEPEIVAQIVATPEQTEFKINKRSMVKQAAEASSSAAVAAAPIANLLRAHTMAKISVSEVTQVTESLVGLGEGEFGVGNGFGGPGGGGSGSGGGMGDGSKLFMGGKVDGQLAVVLDTTGSMWDTVSFVIEEIERSFSTAMIVGVMGAKFTDQPAVGKKLVPIAKSKDWPNRVVRDGEVRPKLKRIYESVAEKKHGFGYDTDGPLEDRQSLGKAMELLLMQPNKPSTIYVFSDFRDGVDDNYMRDIERLIKRTGTKVIFWNPGTWTKDKEKYESFAKTVGGEVKEAGLDSSN